ncbi:hypothetical protein CERSUDRAFT_118969 [Gelatoporia subvermispora B]|uniref:Uncharacterized protein n=1 Tax=Ceriporiopsis subvermispora (strain B) TaxID=914234 RepID=M2R080_CERS8|nr:hypothetical protein CERSUDRAFT_118969 [Gelatoporia subvermispora B]
METQEHIYTVRAKEPTALNGLPSYPVSSSNLILSFTVDTAHVVPGLLDIPKFNAALAHTLSIYPLYTGRLVHPRTPIDHWKLRLSGDGIPVKVRHSDSCEVVEANTVVQSPWTLGERVSMVKVLSGDPSEPLMKVTVTLYPAIGYTCVGISCAHAVGDGFTVCRFLRLLSQTYQGLASLDPYPEYAADIDTPPCMQEVRKFDIPGMEQTYSLNEPPPFLDPKLETTSRVDIRFSARQLKELKTAVLSQRPKTSDAETLFLSTQDTLVALLARCFTIADLEAPPIERITYVVNARGTGSVSPNIGCNGLIWTITEPCTHTKCKPPSLYCIALRIRESLTSGRDADFVSAMDAYCGFKYREAADSFRGQNFTPPPGHMTVNSTYKYDWTSAHFGYLGQTQFFHTNLPAPRYVKIFQANPQISEAGTWIKDEGMAEVTFYLHQRTKQRFVDALKVEAASIGVSGAIEFVDIVRQ